MKRIIIITLTLITSCNVQKRTKPCKECPQFTHYEYPINDVKLSPEYLYEVRLNLYKAGIWIKTDSVK